MVWVLALLGALATGTISAQRVVEIPDRVTCGTCRVQVGPRLSLASTEDFLDGIPQSVTEDASGRVYVVQQASDYPVLVYDQRGRFIRTLGRRGSGPGEFQSAGFAVTGPADSLAVWDYRLSRLTILTSDGVVARSFPFAGDASAILWTSQGFLINAHVATPDRVGLAYHLVDRLGRLIQSFGEIPDALSYGDLSPVSRRLTRLGPRSFLAATTSRRLRIELWNDDRRSREWSRPSTLFDTEASTARKRFPTRVNGLRYDSGTLFILYAVADPNWSKGVRPKRLPDGEETLEFLDVDRIFDTVIEVVDLREGKLITRTSLDEAWFWLLPSGRVARYREGVAGPGLELAAVQLIVP
jgi:hypothetical protein